MVYKLTARFFFDNGQVKKVDWLEDKLVKRVKIDGKDTEVPLTAKEVETEFRKLFLDYAKNGGTLSIPNIHGEISFVPFSKLYYYTLSVEEYKGSAPTTKENKQRKVGTS